MSHAPCLTQPRATEDHTQTRSANFTFRSQFFAFLTLPRSFSLVLFKQTATVCAQRTAASGSRLPCIARAGRGRPPVRMARCLAVHSADAATQRRNLKVSKNQSTRRARTAGPPKVKEEGGSLASVAGSKNCEKGSRGQPAQGRSPNGPNLCSKPSPAPVASS